MLSKLFKKKTQEPTRLYKLITGAFLPAYHQGKVRYKDVHGELIVPIDAEAMSELIGKEKDKVFSYHTPIYLHNAYVGKDFPITDEIREAIEACEHLAEQFRGPWADLFIEAADLGKPFSFKELVDDMELTVQATLGSTRPSSQSKMQSIHKKLGEAFMTSQEEIIEWQLKAFNYHQ